VPAGGDERAAGDVRHPPKLYLGPQDAEALIRRMRRIEGQARGVQRMIQEQAPCEEILIQVEAMRAALQRVKVALGGCHVKQLLLQEFPGEEHLAETLAREVERALRAL